MRPVGESVPVTVIETPFSFSFIVVAGTIAPGVSWYSSLVVVKVNGTLPSEPRSAYTTSPSISIVGSAVFSPFSLP